ncbi:dynein regulatory complex subunit 6 [Monodon monoceros]|uniref:dynein regulatory complex subunit 6 n=1 Tax=Monodon monoceros TaxID=40151 RepID=UPI0010F465C7|nr:dynein regulatory complex subunit 6 [Monodon monoceros]
MCIDPSMKPKIRRLLETYVEQLFGLDDQLVTPELMIKACTFYTGRLLKTHFYTWRKIAIPPTNEDELLAEKMEKSIEYDNFRLKRCVFHHWYSYVKGRKERLKDTLLRVQQMFYCYKLIIILTKWRDKARHKYKEREDELMLKHELQFKKWRSKLKLRVNSKEEYISPQQNVSEVFLVGEIPEFDVSQLPKRTVLQIFSYLSLRDVVICGQVNCSWLLMTQMSSLWNGIDFSTVKNIITDKHIVSTLQRWRLNVLCLNFRGCVLRLKTLRSVSLCRNLQELNVSDCPTLTILPCVFMHDESMRYISESCPGVLYLNLSNTTITNRTMRLLPRYFHSLRNLSLAYCRKFTDKGLQYLNLGNGCHKLIYLDLSGCTQVTDSALEMLSAKCHDLYVLDVSGCILLTDQMLVNLQMGCKQLRILKMLYCRHISKEAAKRMSSIVQQQEYNATDPPLWFGYDCEGKPLPEQQDITQLKDSELMAEESTYSSEEEAV